MKIILLGANGRTGREILKRALDAGDEITALVRAKDKLADISHPHLHIHIGSACDIKTLRRILPGHDVVISTLGPRTPTKAACRIYSESATAIINAMQGCGVSRLLVISTALLFPSEKVLDRILSFIARHNAHAAELMEKTIRDSGLDWTIARVGFLNSNSSIGFRKTEGKLPKGGNSISRSALAHFLLTEAKQSNHINKIVGLCT